MDNNTPSHLSNERAVPRAVWIGGTLMGLAIVGLATALVVQTHGPDGSTPAPLAAASAPLDAYPAAGSAPDATSAPVAVADASPAVAPAVVPVPVPVRPRPPVRHAPPTAPAYTGGGSGIANESERPQRVAAAPVCETCGVIESYSAVQVKGEVNGVGAVAGGVGGALIGNRIAGRGNHTLGGVIGAVGGGLLGNAIEQHERTTTMYDVRVHMEDGSWRTVRQAAVPNVGERVYVDGHTLRARTSQG
jgi:outer membrane lipoprotein SlyB